MKMSSTSLRAALASLVCTMTIGSAIGQEEPINRIPEQRQPVSPSDIPLIPADTPDRVEQEISEMVREREQWLPQVQDGGLALPPIAAVSTETGSIGNGRIPEGFRGGKPSPTQPLPEDARERGEDWNWAVSNWAAANTFSHPRYFEDRMLERHGQERFPCLTPITSGARFFATVPMMPYLMTVRPPCECESTMGYYRSGSCGPVMLQRPPLERNAAVVQAGVVAGVIVAFP